MNSQVVETENIHITTQLTDSLKPKKKRSLIKKSIVPTSLIGLGLIVNNSDFEKKSSIEFTRKSWR